MSRKRIRSNKRKKLVFTGVALVMAAVVLAMGSYAWYTLSTNPEISGIQATLGGGIPIRLSTDNETYDYSITLSVDTSDMAPLVPVSTVDGLNWFVCKYDVDGNVLQSEHEGDESQYMYLRFPKGGNVELTESGLSVDSSNGNKSYGQYTYYVYTDIYMKTGMDKADIYLSLPNEGSAYAEDAEESEKNHYGSYVLSYEVDEEGNVTLLSETSETAVRVGFMVLGEVADGEDSTLTEDQLAETDRVLNPQEYCVSSNGTSVIGTTSVTENRFTIYEPNANLRSYADKEETTYNTDKYISGFYAQSFKYNEEQYGDLNDYYFPTYPIKANSSTLEAIAALLGSGSVAKTDENGAEVKDKDGNTVMLSGNDQIVNWSMDNQTIGTVTEGQPKVYVDGEEYRMSASQLMLQRRSTWKYEDSESQIDAITDKDGTLIDTDNQDLFDKLTSFITKKNATTFDSSMVGEMGKFFDASDMLQYGSGTTTVAEGYVSDIGNTDYTPTHIDGNVDAKDRSEAKITTLEKNKPQKIRIYFWIEGQDVDCWNDIAYTNFMANLEFVADEVD